MDLDWRLRRGVASILILFQLKHGKPLAFVEPGQNNTRAHLLAPPVPQEINIVRVIATIAMSLILVALLFPLGIRFWLPSA